MKQQVHFCKSWFRAKKKPTEVWTEEKARATYVGRQQYTVLIGDVERPFCFLDVADGVVVVGFLDKLLRESLTYMFWEVEPGQLFLATAIHREFDGDTDKVAEAASYMFDRKGAVQIRHEFFNPHRVESASSSCDVEPNYSPVPDFGHYDDLIRIERA